MIDQFIGRAASRHRWAVLLLLFLTMVMAWPGFTTLFPMDRDEPRFAQASKQMLETSDFVDIRLQDGARNKKPVGIYWLQAASVSLAGLLGVADARSMIWVYRLPSLAGALGAVLLTYWAALPLVTRRGAVLAGALMAGTMMLVIEAHLAKTDAALLPTVVAAMAALGRVWMARRRTEPPPGLVLSAVFWTAVAVGILIKGPITPMVALLAAATLSLKGRSARWLLALRPGIGLLWCLLLVLPWFALIVKSTGTAFFADSIGQDMVGKVSTIQEEHGAPFGTYLAAFWLSGWPLAPAVVLAAPAIWHERWTDRTAFLIAWVVPTWLLFELVPTKLPHYVLPTYPALAILAASMLEQMKAGEGVRGIRLGLFASALALAPALLPVALALAKGKAATTIGTGTVLLAALAFGVAGLGSVLTVLAIRRGDAGSAIATTLLAAIAIYLFVFGWFLRPGEADLLALSPRLAAAGRAAVGPDCPAPAFASAGDREPSLVFSTATTLDITDAIGAARFMAQGPCRVAFVEELYEITFAAALKPGLPVRLATRVAGTNINGGHHLEFGVYARGAALP